MNGSEDTGDFAAVLKVCPLSHPPGHGQADFGEALVVIGGIEQKAYFFAFDLPHSVACPKTGEIRTAQIFVGALGACELHLWKPLHAELPLLILRRTQSRRHQSLFL